MACGTPVVGSAVGGIKATVKDGRTGYLVPPNDPEALASRLADLLRDQDRLRTFGLNAIREARANYTWDRVAGTISEVYEEVCDLRRPATVPARKTVRNVWRSLESRLGAAWLSPSTESIQGS
jgi:glycogen synthase